MKRWLPSLLVVAATTVTLAWAGLAASAPVSSASVRVPNIVGKKLPLAEYYIRAAGLRIGREDCDCTFGVVVKSHWYVCIQKPRGGALVPRGTRVGTFSARSRSDC